jgi:hypothetical protein
MSTVESNDAFADEVLTKRCLPVECAPIRAKAHVGEAVGEDFDGAVGIGEEVLRSDVLGRLATDVRVDHRTTWACEL